MSYKVSIIDKELECLELFTSYSQASKYINVHWKTIKRWSEKYNIKYVKGDRFILCFNISFNKQNKGDVRNFTKRVNNW